MINTITFCVSFKTEILYYDVFVLCYQNLLIIFGGNSSIKLVDSVMSKLGCLVAFCVKGMS